MEQVLEYVIALVQGYPVGAMALAGLGSLVVLATVVVGLTPSKSDDLKLEELKSHKYIGLLMKALEKFSLIKK